LLGQEIREIQGRQAHRVLRGRQVLIQQLLARQDHKEKPDPQALKEPQVESDHKAEQDQQVQQDHKEIQAHKEPQAHKAQPEIPDSQDLRVL
jgi:hypothetical protein